MESETIIVSVLEGLETSIKAQKGLTVMEIIRDAGFSELLALCGGACSCATCHIYVDNEFLEKIPAATVIENDLLEGVLERRENSRLSCQIVFNPSLHGLKVSIAPSE